MFVNNNHFYRLHHIFKSCILILAALCSNVWSEPEPSSAAPTISTSMASSKVKRQYSFGRPPNYSPFVGDAARRNADANAQVISQVDQKDANGNYNYAYVFMIFIILMEFT